MDPKTIHTMTPTEFAAFIQQEGGQIEIPEGLLTFDAQPSAAFKAGEAGDDADGKARRFEVQANSGVPFFHPYWGNFAIDFEGLEIPSQKMGLLESHDATRRLGVTDEIKTEKAGLMARGDWLSNDFASAILADMDEGFPFQASVFVPPKNIEFIPEGSETKVNGHKLAGPGHVFRSSTLREVTVAALGADSDTSAVALSKQGRTVSIPKPDQETEMATPQKTPATPAPTAELSAADLQKQHPELVASIEAAAFKAGVTTERERSSEILEVCHDRQISAAQKLVADGVSVKDAFKALLADQTTFAASRREEISAGNDNEPAGESPREPNDTANSGLTAEESAALEWEKDPGVRAEFDDKASFVAYRRANDSGLITRPQSK